GILFRGDLRQGLQITELQGGRFHRKDFCGLGQFFRSLQLPFGVDNLGAPLTLRFSLPGDCPLHLLGQVDVLDLDIGDLHPPRTGMAVEYLLQLLVDFLSVGKELVQFHLAENAPQGGLRQLAGRVEVILHRNDRLLGLHDPEIDNRRHLDRDVVMGDDILGRHLESHGPQGYPDQPVDTGNDEKKPRPPYPHHPPQPEKHAPFVLGQDPHRAADEEDKDDEQKDKRNIIDDIEHDVPSCCLQIFFHLELQAIHSLYRNPAPGVDRLVTPGIPVFAANKYLAVRVDPAFSLSLNSDKPLDTGGRPATMDCHGFGHDHAEETGYGQHRYQDDAPGNAQIRFRRLEQHQRSQHHGYHPSQRQHPVRHDLDLGDQQYQPQKDQQNSGVVDRQGLKGKKSQDQRDAADHPRQNHPGIREFEEQPHDPQHHKHIGHVGIADGVQDPLDRAHIGRHHFGSSQVQNQLPAVPADTSPFQLPQQVAAISGDQVDQAAIQRFFRTQGDAFT